MEVRIVGAANMSKATAEFATLQSQVAALNATMTQSTVIADGINPKGYERLVSAVDAGSKAYRNSLASTGKFRVEQLRLNDATEHYTDLLQRQRLSFRDMRKNSGIMKAAYQEQLRMQEMVVRQTAGIGDGKNVYDVATPKLISKELDTLGRRLVWTGAQLKSAGTQMVNFGKNTQWAGRQLAMGFTMPLLALGAATGVMAYKVDKELTRIAKVYDTTNKIIEGNAESEIAVQRELAQVRVDALKTAGAAADEYGASMTDTLSVQADLAATGKQGAALQASTNEVMRIATLGEFDHATALKTVIALQSILGSTTQETAQQLNYMNSIENATSLATEDFAKAIPVALGPLKEMGGDLQDLSMLLVSMKERGIEAGEGANAIKAMMQRLYRPSRQIREEWEAITNTNITDIRDRNKGNIMGMLEEIEAATRELERPQKVQAIGGLIGTYQVARINAVLGGFKDIQDGVGQTQAVLATNEEGFEQWAATAEREITAFQESASGQFKRAIESLKVEAAEFGQPFLEVGASVVQMIVSIAKAFNDMPDFAKWGVAAVAVFMAIAGPALMLVGLFYNLAGNAVRLVGTVLGLGRAFTITTKQARAQELSMMGVLKQTLVNVPQTRLLAENLGLLGLANAEATRTTEQLMRAQAGSTAASGAAAAADAKETATTKATTSAIREKIATLQQEAAAARKAATSLSADASKARNANNPVMAARWEEAAQRRRMEAKDRHASAGALIREERMRRKAALDSATVANNTEKTSKFAGAAAVGTAAMALSMGAMMVTSNETVHHVAQLVMMAGIVGPAFISLAPHIKAAGEGAVLLGKRMVAASVATKGVAAGAAAAGKAFLAAMGPVGWLITGLTVAGGLLFKIWRNGEKERKEAIKDQKTLNNLMKTYAEENGREWQDARAPERYAITSTKREATAFEKNREYYSSNDAGKSAVEAYERVESSTQKARIEAQMFVESQVNLGESMEKAAARVKAFMVESGHSFAEADARANELINTLGQLNSAAKWKGVMDIEREGLLENAVDIREDRTLKWDLNYDPETASRYAKDNADRIVGSFNEALSNAKNQTETKAAWDNFTQTALVGWQSTWDKYFKHNKEMTDRLKKYGIASAEEMSQVMESMSEIERYNLLRDVTDRDALGDTSEIARGVETAKAISNELIKQAGLTAGMGNGWRTVNDLYKDTHLVAQGLTESEQKRYAIQMKAESLMNPFSNDDARLAAQNAINVANGFKTATDYADAFGYYMSEAVAPVEKTSEKVRKLSADLSTAAGRAQGIANALGNLAHTDMGAFRDTMKTAMQGVQDQVAEDWSEHQNAQMDAEMEGLRNSWDNRIEGINADAERQKAALDTKWENRKESAQKYWDARLESVDKAIKAEEKADEKRQKMFDAEIARIKRLNDLANTNIDFNIALNSGDLDEAARITNNAVAQSDEWAMGDAQEKLAERSAARVEKLQKKSERIEEQRDAAMKAMEKREKAEKAHLDKISDMRKRSAEADRDRAIKNKQAEIELRKKTLDEEIALLQAGTTRNKKELKQRLDDAGIGYDEFKAAVIDPKGKEWGDYFGERLNKGIKLAGQELMSDNMWAELGGVTMKEMAKAMGFANFRSLKHFMKTGEWLDLPDPDAGANGKTRLTNNSSRVYGQFTEKHGGGWAGSGKDSRHGVAKNHKGLHPSEVMVRAQKDEFIVNRDASQKHSSLLQSINDGTFHPGIMGGAGDFMGQGPAVAMAAIMARSMASAVASRMSTAVVDKQTAMAAAATSSYAGSIGNYQLAGVKPWVLEAANYLGGKFGISSIGGLGDRPANSLSDHPKGLALDFMTTDVEKGNALAAEALKLQNVLDATYMIWRAQIHSFDSRGWRPYRHPSGATDPTSMHMDHVHLSFSPSGKVGDLPKSTVPSGSSGMVIPGLGGKAHPTGRVGSQGSRLHGSPPAIDISLPVGNKIYAAGDGRVSGSYDIPGYEPRAPHGGNGYKSYGRVITIAHDNGGSSLYAHLSQRFAQTGQRVTGGSVIGLSGDTGYSTGPHLHFGGTPSPFAYLKKGAANINFDNTPAILHKNEAVLTEDLNKKFHQGVENFANGGSNEYNIKVEINGANKDVSTLAKEVVKVIRREESRLPQNRTAR